mmetsp:Transcript_4835/g.11698  ORF Transcript_4835/g.11698 Transcript_4835/m.11698 type:complete len:107 (+) Transcript_4835:555-875(+)
MHVKGTMCGDWVAHCLFQPCAVLQEYRSAKLQRWRVPDNVWSQMGVEHVSVGTLTVDGHVTAVHSMGDGIDSARHLAASRDGIDSARYLAASRDEDFPGRGGGGGS